MNSSDKIHFLITKEYRKFAEFCNACSQYRYIGLCYGSPGVGKTLSARHFLMWDLIEYYISIYYTDEEIKWSDIINKCSILYTPRVAVSIRTLEKEVNDVIHKFNILIGRAEMESTSIKKKSIIRKRNDTYCKLIIIDEADRLTSNGLEVIRDIYDRNKIGIILIGMPGIEKRFSRYGQFYSRVGFVHNFKSISSEEMGHLLKYKWKELGLSFDPIDFSDQEAINDIVRITRGNFRLLQRLFTQIDRVMKINMCNFISKEVVEAARENLIIGEV